MRTTRKILPVFLCALAMTAAAQDNSPDYSQLGWKGLQDEEDEVLTAAYNSLNHELFGGTTPAPASIAWRNEHQMTDWDGLDGCA
jgi:hypothetical protein